MKKLMGIVAATMLAGVTMANDIFTTDYDAALKRAQTSGRPMFVLFTGSDWCGWCIKLEGEVFSKDEFIKEATNRWEMVMLDFPSKKPQSEELKKRNQELAKKYGVRGYPTVLLVDKNETVIGEGGYHEGGPVKWLEWFDAKTKFGAMVAQHLAAEKKAIDKFTKDSQRAYRKAVKGAKDRVAYCAAVKPFAEKELVKLNELIGKVKSKEVPAEVEPAKKDMLDQLEETRVTLEGLVKITPEGLGE